MTYRSNLGDLLGLRGDWSGDRRGEPGVTGGDARGDPDTGDASPEPRDMPHSDEPWRLPWFSKSFNSTKPDTKLKFEIHTY